MLKIINRIKKSILWGIIGFLIPVVILGTIGIYRILYIDLHPLDRHEHLPGMILIPACACAFLFALATLASGTQKTSISFIRSLSIIGSTVVIAVLATTSRIPTRIINPYAWGDIAVPIGIGIISTLLIVVYNVLQSRSSKTDGT